MAKIANAYLDYEAEHDRPVWAIRPPYHHMRLLRWQLRTVMRFANPWDDAQQSWIPPTANSERGDQWWFRGSFIARLSSGARRAVNSTAAWMALGKQTVGRLCDLGEYRGFRLDAPMLILPAPKHTAYRGHRIAVPSAALREHAHHHLRRTLAHLDQRYAHGTPWTLRRG